MRKRVEWSTYKASWLLDRRLRTYRLKKAFYGLESASRAWKFGFHEVHVELG